MHFATYVISPNALISKLSQLVTKIVCIHFFFFIRQAIYTVGRNNKVRFYEIDFKFCYIINKNQIPIQIIFLVSRVVVYFEM